MPLVWLADICYWVLPKPVDLGRLVFDALGGSISRPVLESTAAVSLPLAIITSLLVHRLLLLAACRQFARHRLSSSFLTQARGSRSPVGPSQPCFRLSFGF